MVREVIQLNLPRILQRNHPITSWQFLEHGIEEGGFTGRGTTTNNNIFLGMHCPFNEPFNIILFKQCEQRPIFSIILLANHRIFKCTELFILIQVKVQHGLLTNGYSNPPRLTSRWENHLNTITIR